MVNFFRFIRNCIFFSTFGLHSEAAQAQYKSLNINKCGGLVLRNPQMTVNIKDLYGNKVKNSRKQILAGIFNKMHSI